MKDTFKTRYRNLESPAANGFAITPSNDSLLPYAARAFYVGGEGSVSLVTSAGDTITLVGVKAGAIYPISIIKVNATGTSATNLVGLY